jgi:hypothetical protein
MPNGQEVPEDDCAPTAKPNWRNNEPALGEKQNH